MYLPIAKVSPPAILALLATVILLTAGCYYPTEGRSVYGTESRSGSSVGLPVPTALVIVIDDESTEADYQVRRGEIIAYLIERGYIASADELVSDPANADRIIRAIVSGGGYSLSIFNKNTTTGPMPDLEVTDILYPADPYFILGFLYLNEIGPRRLPPRPPGYYPHPRPPHSAPPSGRHVYDHDRHWSRSGQPDRNDGRSGPPPDRRRRDDNHPRPELSAQPPPAVPTRKPEDRGPTRPDNRVKPPTGVPPTGRDHPKPEQDAPAPAATPPNGPNRPQSHESDQPTRPATTGSQASSGAGRSGSSGGNRAPSARGDGGKRSSSPSSSSSQSAPASSSASSSSSSSSSPSASAPASTPASSTSNSSSDSRRQEH